jgi:polysaccharide biosynthesis transport protein
MNDLTPVPSSGSAAQPLAPMGGNPAASSPKFRVHKFLLCLRKFWWIPTVTMILGLGVAVFTFFHTPPIFVSSGRLWETEKLRLPDGAAFTDDRDNYLGTQSELLRSPMLRQLVLNRMRAVETNSISVGADGQPLPVQIQVFTSPKSSVYAVEARSANPAFTPAYLDALMNEYLEYRKNIRSEVSSFTLDSIRAQIEKLERELKADQATLANYEQSNNFAVLQQENLIEGSYLGKLKTELYDYQLQMELLDASALEQDSVLAGATNAVDLLFETLHNSGSATSSTAGRYDAVRQIELLKLDRQRLSKYLRPQHPKIVKLDEEIARSQKLIDVYRQQNQEQITTARQALQIRMDDTKAFIKQWEDKLSDSNTRIAAADGLKQNVARNQVMYDRLVALLQNVDISRNIDQDTLAILEPASPATRSYQEVKSMMTQRVMIGLVLGLGIVFLLALRDDRFMSVVEVTDKFGDNVVGQVPEVPKLAGAAPALLESNDERHIYAESYRNLRSALLYLAIDGQRPKVLLITSAVPNEGKSTVASNLARVMAMGSSRVLLIDGDLRKGHLHESLGLQSKPGLSNLLSQPEGAIQFIQPTNLANLMFLARGDVSGNPGDLFLSPEFDRLLARLREEYDYILIDSSPVFASDDATTLAPKMDGTLFVVRSRFSRARTVNQALELLNQRQVRLLGMVLNRADATARSYDFYKYKEYYPAVTKV